MAVQPNDTCRDFCEFIFQAYWIEATQPQLNLVGEIYTAAVNVTEVTNHTWNEYLRITGKWFIYYQAWIAQIDRTSDEFYYYA